MRLLTNLPRVGTVHLGRVLLFRIRLAHLLLTSNNDRPILPARFRAAVGTILQPRFGLPDHLANQQRPLLGRRNPVHPRGGNPPAPTGKLSGQRRRVGVCLAQYFVRHDNGV